MTARKVEHTPLHREQKPDLQERVRRFNLGTPTPMHVATYELVNDLWKANADMLAALQAVMAEWREGYGLHCVKQVQSAIAAAVADRPADAASSDTR